MKVWDINSPVCLGSGQYVWCSSIRNDQEHCWKVPKPRQPPAALFQVNPVEAPHFHDLIKLLSWWEFSLPDLLHPISIALNGLMKMKPDLNPIEGDLSEISGQCILHQHYQNPIWRNIFWQNIVHHSSTVPKTWHVLVACVGPGTLVKVPVIFDPFVWA